MVDLTMPVLPVLGVPMEYSSAKGGEHVFRHCHGPEYIS